MLEVAIIGAGPYGLSIAAHLRRSGVPFRIFGRPMDSWLNHMPKGMFLKSDGFASNISDPVGELTLRRFCEDNGIEYADSALPVALDTFTAYGLTFRERMVPNLEEKMVEHVTRIPGGFRIRLDDGEEFDTRRVVLAVGITHFAHLPEQLAGFSPDLVSHSSRHRDLEHFRGKRVAVVGAGSSALDIAGLLNEIGTEVTLIARPTALKFHGKPIPGKPRSTWDRIRRPQSGLGPGFKSRFFSNAPLCFYHLPQSMRLKIVKTHLGPSGGWFIKDKVVGRVSLMLGTTIDRVDASGANVRLSLAAVDGMRREIEVDHVIAGTGYKVDLRRLAFLDESVRAKVELLEQSPVLSTTFESSVPGLFFIGVAAANSFGPLMRFAYGADFSARHLGKALANSFSKSKITASVPETVALSR
jgi:thioredoxin reductase